MFTWCALPPISAVLLAAVGVLGCHPSSAAMSMPVQRLSGIVRSAEGVPATDGVVIATDPATTDEIATTRISLDGSFAIDISLPHVALTATPRNEKSFELYDLRAIDGALLFDAVTPSRPLLTADGRSKVSP
jgi:hypothetical protein